MYINQSKIQNPKSKIRNDLSNLLTARLSRHIVLWVFASLVVIEAMILIPSVQRREREMLNQIQQVSSGKVFWIATTYPNLSAEAFFDRVQQLQKDPMLQILGGAVYTSDGRLVGTFGEKPALTHASVMADNPMSFEASDRRFAWGDRYDASWLIPHTGGNHILVIRHNAASARSEVFAFIFRVAGMVLMISAVLTITTLAVLATTVITPILRLREDLIAAGEAVSKDQPTPLFYSAIVKRQDELGDVIAAFNQMFKQIWQAMAERKQAEQALAEANQEITGLNQKLTAENLRMSAELAVSRKLQQMLLPKEHELNQIPGLEIAGFMEPATEVGGDYYDVLNHNGNVKIGIGDVTGHGLESGVVMLMTQTATRTLLANNETDPVKFLNTLNQTIYGNIHRMSCDKSLTLSLLDYQDGQIRLSGQHEEVILVRKDGSIERIDTINLGFPLGLEEDIADLIAHTQIDLNPGDGIVLYTDGITEAQNLQKDCYGLERLCETVQRCWHLSTKEVQRAVIQDVQQFIGEQNVNDDLTLLVLKQK
jgi:serine phosphatase RsbU (regulator of sigma subunit)